MHYIRAAGRSALLTLSLLSACAATSQAQDPAGVQASAYGNFLAGQYALISGDTGTAADYLLKAAALAPDDKDVALPAFIAAVEAGRPAAVHLAAQLPETQVAQLVLADAAAEAGQWDKAAAHFRALPAQGLTQLLQPMLLAWAQQGAGQSKAALATLKPFVDNPHLRALFALQAAMIADQANLKSLATQYYGALGAGGLPFNLRLAQILSSWQARSGYTAEAERTLGLLPQTAPDLAIVLPALLAHVDQRPVPDAVAGIAETYFTFAGVLRSRNADTFSLILLRLALGLRPDFTAARLLAADIVAGENHPHQALALLRPVQDDDPLIALVRLRRDSLLDQVGQSHEALSDLALMVKAYPDSPLPPTEQGDILRSKGRFSEAVTAYDLAIARAGNPKPDDWVLFYNRGIAEERSNQWPKARADFEQALKLSPNQPFVLNYLGYSLANKGEDLHSAQKMIQTAAQQMPNDGAVTDSLGWVLFRQGHFRQAVKILQRAVEMEPEDPTINGHLGDAYAAVGRKIEALYQWQRALTFHPSAEDAKRIEAKLAENKVSAETTKR